MTHATHFAADKTTGIFRSIGHWLVDLAERSPMNRAVTKLNATTDEELAARGTTRRAEIERLFKPAFYV
ncbi:MAG: DUF1127 domain-containing protein [Paracoccaceae bacterium]